MQEQMRFNAILSQNEFWDYQENDAFNYCRGFLNSYEKVCHRSFRLWILDLRKHKFFSQKQRKKC